MGSLMFDKIVYIKKMRNECIRNSLSFVLKKWTIMIVYLINVSNSGYRV